jgi:hypothetical protein
MQLLRGFAGSTVQTMDSPGWFFLEGQIPELLDFHIPRDPENNQELHCVACLVAFLVPLPCLSIRFLNLENKDNSAP